ncbi:MAG TPA: helix-turn-helix domain-containing protein [Candidatus Saccharimonadales bacterium]|nr:helix-turn-helix domain-containing protein [Candidatus Saccharimonadales bacterium]
MSKAVTHLYLYFAKLGLSAETADIYMALREYGPQSLLQLSRNANVERTRLYRLLDGLLTSQLIEIEEHYKRRTYKAAPIANLQILFARRQQEISDLQEELQLLQAKLDRSTQDPTLTHVQFYRGEEGIKQMLWNETRGSGENLSILFGNMQTYVRASFFSRWAERCNERDIIFRSIVGDHFLQMQRAWYQKHDNVRLTNWQGRYVSEKIFLITQSMVIYDNVVAHYGWKDGEVFGSETYNNEVANTQRQFFEMLWKLGKPLPNHGLKTDDTLQEINY